MQFLQYFQELLDNGDPELNKWFLIRNNYLPFILTFSYVIMTMVGPTFMKYREPFKIRKLMIIFNFTIVFIYLIALLIAAYYLPQITWHEFCIDGQVKKGDVTYWLCCAGYYVYILKYVEYLDTLFFILRKKEHLISFLHVFHHCSVPLFAWFLLKTEKNGLQSVPAVLNSFVHVIMYTYYGLAAMGPKMRKYLWWKRYLTQLQIAQFILILLFFTVIAPMSGCKLAATSWVIHLCLISSFLYLFLRFYMMAFKAKAKKQDGTDRKPDNKVQ